MIWKRWLPASKDAEPSFFEFCFRIWLRFILRVLLAALVTKRLPLLLLDLSTGFWLSGLPTAF